MRRTLAILVVVLAVMVQGCSTVQELARAQKPRVTVANARISGLSFDAVDLAVDLKVINPNSFSLPLAGLDFDLSLDGRSVLTGNRPQSVTVPAGGQRIISLPLSLRFRDLYASVTSLHGRDEATYGLSCGLSFDLPVLGRTKVPVQHAGTLPMVKLPSLSVSRLHVRDLTLTGATMDIVLSMSNPNAFDLSMKQIGYNLSINGASWVTGQSHRTDSIPRKGHGELRIPVSLDFLHIGAGIYDLVRGSSEVSYQLGGSVGLGTSLPLLQQATLPLNESGSIRITR
ncbi:LEA type 2 family protein [Candidatus Fermentibacteria bacterium]|nr:LEA type 2 family protein [Candidatus Fermentibacteria bacterium]